MPANRHPADAKAAVRSLRVAHAVAMSVAEVIGMHPQDVAEFDRLEGIARMLEDRRPAWGTYDMGWVTELSRRVDHKLVADKVPGKLQEVLSLALNVPAMLIIVAQEDEAFERRGMMDVFAFASLATKDADEAGAPVAVNVGRVLGIDWPTWRAAKANKRLGSIIIDALKN